MMTYWRTMQFSAWLMILAIGGQVLNTEAAMVQTKRGERAGRVIVRVFYHIVVTIITPEKRLFQFAAADVESITSEQKLLVGVNTFLRKSPSDDGEPLVPLTRGLEVNILEKSADNRWVKVQAWDEQTGWIYKDVLTDRVVFTPEEKKMLSPRVIPARSSLLQGSESIKDSTESTTAPGDSSK